MAVDYDSFAHEWFDEDEKIEGRRIHIMERIVRFSEIMEKEKIIKEGESILVNGDLISESFKEMFKNKKIINTNTGEVLNDVLDEVLKRIGDIYCRCYRGGIKEINYHDDHVPFYIANGKIGIEGSDIVENMVPNTIYLIIEKHAKPEMLYLILRYGIEYPSYQYCLITVPGEVFQLEKENKILARCQPLIKEFEEPELRAIVYADKDRNRVCICKRGHTLASLLGYLMARYK